MKRHQNLLEYLLIAALLAMGVVAALGISAHAQSAPPAQKWFTVVPASGQGKSVTVTMPPGTQYQIVAPGCPNPVAVPVATATAVGVVDYADGLEGRPADSCPGTSKAFQVLETAAPQLIVTDDPTASPSHWTFVVPPLPAPPPVLSGGPHQVVLRDFHDDGGSTAALLLWAANQPASAATQTWGGTSFTLTIDGYPLTCSYGQTYSAGVFSLSCTAAPASQ